MAESEEIVDLRKEIRDLKEQLASQQSMYEMTTTYLNRLKKELEISESNVKQANKNMRSSIEYAKYIQDAFLVDNQILQDIFPDSFLFFKPRDIVSGDFVWMQQQDEYIYLGLGDCTGHGVPGAMLSIFMISQLNEIILNCKHCLPAEIILQLNSNINSFLKQYKANMKDTVEIALIRYNPRQNELIFCGAKRPLILISPSEFKVYPGNVFFLGDSIRSVEQPTNIPINAEPGAMLYLFSDGFQDQFGGEKNKKFGKSNLYETFKAMHLLDVNEQKEALETIFETWKGENGQVDDAAILGIKWNMI